jgi:hypothetical protein
MCHEEVIIMKRFASETGEALMFMLFTIAAVLAAIFFPLWAKGESLPSPSQENELIIPRGADELVEAQIVQYIREFVSKPCAGIRQARWKIRCMENMRQKTRWNRAPALAEMIVKVARERDLDPWTVVVTVRCESSFWEKVRDGDVGEQGLMQVHGQALQWALAKGYDLSTSWGQLQAGADHLLHAFEKCKGSVEEAFSKYRSGHCKTKKRHGKRRERMLRKAHISFPGVD